MNHLCDTIYILEDQYKDNIDIISKKYMVLK